LIETDYTQEPDTIFWKISVIMLEQMKSLAILSYVWHSEEDIGSLSWVPKWNWAPRSLLPRPGRTRFYDAGLISEYPSSNHFITNIHVDMETSLSKTLDVQGLVFDSIQASSVEMTWEDFSRKKGSRMKDGGVINPVELAWKIAFDSKILEPSLDEEIVFSLTLSVGIDAYDKDIEKDENDIMTLRDNFRAYRQKYCDYVSTHIERPSSGIFGKPFIIGNEGRFTYQAQYYCSHRKFFKTAKGLLGVGPPVMKHGDLCCVLFGSTVPFIIRPTGYRFQYQLIGECYVQGVMRGEVVRKWELGDLEDESITLV
jgi:hypothetical protein